LRYSQAATLVIKSAAPVITNNNQTKNVVSGETTSFTVNATGTGTLSYQWCDANGFELSDGNTIGGVLSGAKTNTLTISNAGSHGVYNYRCKVTNRRGNMGMNSLYANATLNVLVPVPPSTPMPPNIIKDPLNRTVTVGQDATFRVEASGAETYQWEAFVGGVWSNAINGAAYSGANSPELTVRNVTLSRNGTRYRCKVTNNVGTVSSAAANLTVYQTVSEIPIPPTTARIDQQPSDRSIATGQSTTFYVEAVGLGLSYKWQYMPAMSTISTPWTDISDGGIYSGAKTDTLRLNDIPASYAGYQYRCVVTYMGLGMTTRTLESNSAKLTITDAGSVSLINMIIFNGMTDLTLLNGYAATSTDAYSVLRMSFGSQPTFTVTQNSTHGGKITWNNSTKKLDIAAGLAKGTYPVVMTAATGGSGNATLTFTLTVTDEMIPADISGTAGMTLAAGYTATSTGAYTITGAPTPTVTKTSGNAAITWDNANKRLNIAAGLAVGTYSVVLKAVNSAGESELTFTLTVENPMLPPSETPFPFTDVLPSHWFYDDVKTAWRQDLIDGTSATTYSPNNNLTYAQAIKLAACIHQLYNTGAVTLVNGSPNWYDSFVTYAKNNGIISKDYTWSAPATRAGYMEIFANALPASAFAAINTIPDGSIPDVPMTHPQAAAIYKLYRAGILQGTGAAHNCNPGSNIRRSEVAAVLTRMMNESERIPFSI